METQDRYYKVFHLTFHALRNVIDDRIVCSLASLSHVPYLLSGT